MLHDHIRCVLPLFRINFRGLGGYPVPVPMSAILIFIPSLIGIGERRLEPKTSFHMKCCKFNLVIDQQRTETFWKYTGTYYLKDEAYVRPRPYSPTREVGVELGAEVVIGAKLSPCRQGVDQ